MLSRTKFAALALFVVSVCVYTGATQAQERGSEVLAKGEFHKAEKPGKGTATVYLLANGKRVLRLSNFETDNGPDLHVRLIAADDAKDTASVVKADYVEVAKLKGNKGAQNYELPENVDLGKYRVVSIWCNRFSVNFAAAPLTAAGERGSKVLAKGEFHKAAKAGKGTATVYLLPNGKRVLRLSNFETDNGPDLHVRLIAADDAKDTASVAKTDYVEVAKLKGNKGAQNYELPENVDLGKYRVVSIWCNRFSVNFAAAPLTAAE